MRMAGRLQAMSHPAYDGATRRTGKKNVWTGKLHLNKNILEAPLKWRQPKRIFVNSMSDLFQDGVPEDFLGDVWSVMERAHWHTFQILTKRPENMRSSILRNRFPTLENVWLGTSVENRNYKARISELRKTPSFVRFVSFEPLIGSVGKTNLCDIDWAIVGGESGPHSRPMEAEWVEEILHSCQRHKTAFFFKQWGGKNKKKAGRIFMGRTWDEYPTKDLIAAE